MLAVENMSLNQTVGDTTEYDDLLDCVHNCTEQVGSEESGVFINTPYVLVNFQKNS